MSQGIPEANSDPLHAVSEVLHRLETHLARQDARLRFIESCIRSGATSPVSDVPSIQEETLELARVNQSSEPSQARYKSLGAPSEVASLAATYRASLLNLQARFLNSSDIDRDGCLHQMYSKVVAESRMENSTPQLNLPLEPVNPSENPDLIYDDAYSVSVYPSEPFTRSEIFKRSEVDIPPVPALPTISIIERLSTDGIGTLEQSIPYSSTVSTAQTSSQTPPTSPISRSSSLKFWKTRSNRDTMVTAQSTASSTFASQTRQPHIRAEITYHAYENFWGSVFSSAEKRASRKEIHRLQALAVPTARNEDAK